MTWFLSYRTPALRKKNPTSGQLDRKWGIALVLTASHRGALCAVSRVEYAERVAAVRPDQKQCILTLRYVRQSLLHFARGLDLVAIHFEDDVTLLKAGIVGWATGLHLLDNRSLNFTRSLDLIAEFRSEISETNSPARPALLPFPGTRSGFGGPVAKILERDGHLHGFAFAKDRELNFRARLVLSDNHLKFTGIGDLLSVDVGDDIADLKSRFRPRANLHPPG